MATPSLWIVVPAFNEGGVIGRVVSDLCRKYLNVVVIDDCSSDNTGAAARAAGATVLRHVVNLGQGAALQTGIDYALRMGAEFVITFDADGQHRVEDIEVLCTVQRNCGAKVVIGSRFLGYAEGMPLSRKLLLKSAVLFMRISSGIRLTDAHNGLRLLSREAASAIEITQNRMSHASEMINQFSALSMPVAEAPVTILYTHYSLKKGQKFMNAFNILFESALGFLIK